MKVKLFILLFFTTSLTIGQTYFNKTFGSISPFNGGLTIISHDSSYYIGGNCDFENKFKLNNTFVKLNKFGDSLISKSYGNDSITYLSTSHNGIIVQNYFVESGSIVFPNNYNNIILQKKNLLGDTIWTKQYDIENSELSRSIIQTSDKGFLLGGFTQPYDGTTYGRAKWFVLKTDSNGTEQWRKTWVNIYGDLREIIQTKDGNYVLAGWHEPTSGFNYEHQVIKIDTGGNIIWQKRFGISQSEGLGGIVELEDSTLIVYGNRHNIGDVERSYYTGKLDFYGDIIWEKTYGIPIQTNIIRNLEVLPDGSFIACGQGSAQGTSSTKVRGTIMKFCPTGELLWERKYGAIDFSSYLYDIELTTDGGFIATGSTKGSSGTQDLWVIKTDSLGCDTPGCAVAPAPCPKDTTGINELLINNSQLVVYPNPFTHSFAVRVAGAEYGELRVRLTDIVGRVQLLNYSYSNNKLQFDGSNLTSGIYILDIKGVGQTKVVKQ